MKKIVFTLLFITGLSIITWAQTKEKSSTSTKNNQNQTPPKGSGIMHQMHIKTACSSPK